jgi:uncharacterized membrane protein YhaH (DUF805 family)
MTRAHFAFLYRGTEGRIDQATWWRAQAPLSALLAVLTAGWLLLAPYTHRSLENTRFFEPATIFAFAYLVLYAFALILLVVASTFVSAKRFRDRGLPPGLAGLAPFAALLAGAVWWGQRQEGGFYPYWIVIVGYGLFAAALAWSLYELGVAGPRGLR